MTLILEYRDQLNFISDGAILEDSSFWSGMDQPTVDVDGDSSQILVYLNYTDIKSISELSVIFKNDSELYLIATNWILNFEEI